MLGSPLGTRPAQFQLFDQMDPVHLTLAAGQLHRTTAWRMNSPPLIVRALHLSLLKLTHLATERNSKQAKCQA